MSIQRATLISLLTFSLACAQTAEITTKETAVTFKSGVNMVPVPVVVRDSNGRPVGNLAIDDFQLFDNGKPQMISKFSVEKLTKTQTIGRPAEKAVVAGGTPAAANSQAIPDRFVAYVFDDLHMSHSDLVYTRDAVKRQIDSLDFSRERAAIYTTSGSAAQEFTTDTHKLDATLAALHTGRANLTRLALESGCPPMTYYMGNLIYNTRDEAAHRIVLTEAGICKGGRAILSVAREAFLTGNVDTQAAIDAIRNVIARLASMPGQRSLVLISPGFLVLDDYRDQQTGLIERAIRSNVVIGALDARGAYTKNGVPNASEMVIATSMMAEKGAYTRMEAAAQAEVMASLAEGTGGAFYFGTNDLDAGIARVAATTEIVYVLGFSPPGLKPDGKHHNLTVTLKQGRGLDLQFRKGYYAPQHAADPAERKKQELEEAFFSQAEVRDLPAVLQTEFFRGDAGEATLTAAAKIDVKNIVFRKENGRNLNNLTVVTGLFDSDGNFLTATQKIVELRLLDETLEKRLPGGMSVKNDFSVRAGKYIVRMVVRDSESQLMAEQSSLVEIP